MRNFRQGFASRASWPASFDAGLQHDHRRPRSEGPPRGCTPDHAYHAQKSRTSRSSAKPGFDDGLLPRQADRRLPLGHGARGGPTLAPGRDRPRHLRHEAAPRSTATPASTSVPRRCTSGRTPTRPKRAPPKGVVINASQLRALQDLRRRRPLPDHRVDRARRRRRPQVHRHVRPSRASPVPRSAVPDRFLSRLPIPRPVEDRCVHRLEPSHLGAIDRAVSAALCFRPTQARAPSGCAARAARFTGTASAPLRRRSFPKADDFEGSSVPPRKCRVWLDAMKGSVQGSQRRPHQDPPAGRASARSGKKVVLPAIRSSCPRRRCATSTASSARRG